MSSMFSRDRSRLPLLEGNDIRPSSMMIAVYPPKEFIDVAKPLASKTQLEDGIHMTLMYLGQKTEAEAAELIKMLSTESQKMPVMDLNVTGSGAFFTPNALVRVLLMNSPQLPRVRYAIEKVLDDLGMTPPSKYGYIPHVTLEYHDDYQVPAGWEKQALMSFPDMAIREIHVVRGNDVVASLPIGGVPSHLSDLGFKDESEDT